MADDSNAGADRARPDWRPGPSLASRISWIYCRHQSVFWLALALLVLFLAIATWMSVRYRCWQWRVDPVASAVMERRRRRLPTPYSYFATV